VSGDPGSGGTGSGGTDPGAGSPGTGPEQAADAVRARGTARAAAERAGIDVRPLRDAADAVRAIALFDGIWRTAAADRPISTELLVALAHSGNYVAGAFAADELVGAAAGFLAAPAGRGLHSHIAGVSARARGRHVGLALKLDQRAWALEAGLAEITWTFDPLVRRNAAFNLRRLRARAAEYLRDFYGEMRDSVNAGDASDRLLVAWPLADDDVATACEGTAVAPSLPPAVPVLQVGPDGGPAAVDAAPGARAVAASTPVDIETMRRERPDLARAWRVALRDTLGDLMAEGAPVVGLTPEGSYVVVRGDAASDPGPDRTPTGEGR
jgi:predicted GNAT superfamily acetyltransferase